MRKGWQTTSRMAILYRRLRTVGTLSATATASGDFTSRALFTRAEEAVLTATSSFGTTTGPEKAADGSLTTEWRTALGVTTAGFDVALPVGATVDAIRIFPHSLASLSSVQVDLCGGSGQLLDSRTASFTVPNGVVNLSVTRPVSGVQRVSFTTHAGYRRCTPPGLLDTLHAA